MTEPASQVQRSPGPGRLALARFRRSRAGMAGLAIVLTLVLVALLAPLLANAHPIACRFDGTLHFPALVDVAHRIPWLDRWLPKSTPFRLPQFDYRREFDASRGDWQIPPLIPFGPEEIVAGGLEPASARHWLGTDDNGRDLLSRLVHGTSVSLRVGLIAMGIALVIGVVLGCAAGYCGGLLDLAVSRLMEIVLCFPTLFFILAILAWLPPRIENVMVVIGLTRWVSIARFLRAEVMRLRGAEFVLAARALGASPARIVSRHLLPNSMAPVLVDVTFGVSAAIFAEAALSWLGLGVQPPAPSWGNILREGYSVFATTPRVVCSACLVLFLAVLSVNLVGDGLRQSLDPNAGTPRRRRRPYSSTASAARMAP